ncbi:acyl-CoA carboxylase epsilon subunit [Streptomyces sp. NPDC085946]|uniref:acyl-CoA carboxylase epsilon subunit n=1 Tax=Streptomyces sp. NPDC085946 TaxID=3365744 RepID=UPI0037CD0CD2
MTMNLSETLIRIESGAPDDDELAALTAVLLARIAAPAHDADAGTDTGRNVARWRRLERMPGPRIPHSWQSATGRTSGWAA